MTISWCITSVNRLSPSPNRREQTQATVTWTGKLMLITLAVITGLGLGSMYGLLALGLPSTYTVAHTVNFSQGSAMMLGAVLCYTLHVTLGWAAPISVGLTLLLCALWGLVVERCAVRPFVWRGSTAWLMSTVALGLVLENAALFTFGKEP